MYKFETLKISGAPLFMGKINSGGHAALYAPPVGDLLRRQDIIFHPCGTLSASSEGDFESRYNPTIAVARPYPIEAIEFDRSHAASIYYWEIFFHVPMLIVERLRAEGKFEEAIDWLQYIFDPTNMEPTELADPKRFWMLRPFHDYSGGSSIRTMMASMAGAAPGDPATIGSLRLQIEQWRSDPFDPHGLASIRLFAYMIWVFTSYVETLIEWGDALFTLDTREAINEATQCYVFAGQLLGRKPGTVERPAGKALTFKQLVNSLDDFSNAAVQVESALPALPQIPLSGGTIRPAIDGPRPAAKALYFCVPDNPHLLELWDRIADRLFKIRHCMNIKGERRELALFAPPIDPGLLVKARAAGLDLGDVIAGLYAPPPHYRFTFLLQKANEFAADVKSFGGALLSAIEKGDSEAMAQLRSEQEISLQTATRQVRSRQLAEAKQQLASTLETRKVTETRLADYKNRQDRIVEEYHAKDQRKTSEDMLLIQKGSQILGAALSNIPDAYVGPMPLVQAIGGKKLAYASELFGSAWGGVAEWYRNKSVASADEASVKRRREEWDLQIDLADAELKQIDRQIAAAEIRVAIAEQELANLDLQIEHAKESFEFMKSKFSNAALYQWMVGELSRLHRESFQLARNLAKQAERALAFELGAPTRTIGGGHWIAGRKGLLAGEMLAQDLRYLDAEYLERNTRTYELKRDISLRLLDPEALLALTIARAPDPPEEAELECSEPDTVKREFACEFELPEWLFQMDAPGLFNRRIKSLALSIPCVTGPYTPVHCRLTLLSHEIRASADREIVPERRYDAMQSIVTSGGLNDSGVFEPNLQDPRYLPFEGCGVVARFRLEILNPDQFDVTTISDAILHIRYTALDGGEVFKFEERDIVCSAVNDNIAHPGLLLSFRHDFPDEWTALSAAAGVAVMPAPLPAAPRERIPYRARATAGGYQSPVMKWLLLADQDLGIHQLIEFPPQPPLPPTTTITISNGQLTYDIDGKAWTVADIILLYTKT